MLELPSTDSGIPGIFRGLDPDVEAIDGVRCRRGGPRGDVGPGSDMV